jgi:hypothetical protein
MSKVLIIDENYPNYLNQFKERNNLRNLNYEECLDLLRKNYFACNGGFIKPLNQLGYVVMEIYYNFDILQEKWKNQYGHNKNIKPYKPAFEILYLQIFDFKPDILYVTNPHIFDTNFIRHVKETFPFIKVYACYFGVPFKEYLASDFDICFTAIPQFYKLVKDIKPSYIMPMAFNPEILEHLTSSNNPFELIFAGSIVRSNDMHSERLNYLDALSQITPISLFSEAFNLSLKKDLLENFKKKTASIIIIFLRFLKLKDESLSKLPLIGRASRWKSHYFRLFPNKLKSKINPPLFGLEMYQKFSENKIVFNIHIDSTGDEAGNMRLFEATGVGACLLTDYKSNIKDYFEPGKEIITYNSVEDCKEKIKWLLANPEECKKIARAGQIRTLKGHTYAQRALIMHEAFKNFFINVEKRTSDC